MTIKECIDIVDNLKPNQYSTKEKVLWLSFIDETIVNDVLKTHEGYDGRYDTFTGYSEDKLSVSLIVSSPYDRLYTAYLKMKIDGENGETARYNNSASLFNTYMMEYRKYYNKTHMPLTNGAPISHNATSLNVTETRLEYLKKELYTKLYNDISKMVSEMFNGKDNIESMVEKAVAQANKISFVTLYSNQWKGTTSPYSQVVSISGVTKNSKVDLNPTVAQLEIFHDKDITFLVENTNGIITVYCIGQKPTNDYTIQATITEVKVNE